MEWTPGHPIKVAVRRTGLSAHVIRVWEKRYGAVVPARTPTNRRLYSDEDIVRLQWLRQAVEAGQSIGRIAGLPTSELVETGPRRGNLRAAGSRSGRRRGRGRRQRRAP